MPLEQSAEKGLRAAIIGETKKFLIGLDSGASDEALTYILQSIKEKELMLLKQERTMLDPELWQLLRKRLANRRKKDILDTAD